MERPKIKDKSVLEYVTYLEGIVEQFNIDGIKYRTYGSIVKTIDDYNDLLNEEHEIKDPESGEVKKVKLISFDSFTDGQDKFFDRVKVFMKEGPLWVDGAEKMLDGIRKEIIEKEEIRHKHKTQDFFK